MTVENRLALSYYNKISDIDTSHNVSLVKHTETGKIFVMKSMSIFNKAVYSSLLGNQIPGIPKVYEVLENDNELIVIEEYISGESLDEILRQSGGINEEAVINYTIQLCDILSELHGLNPPVIHRDVKPSNIIINPNGILTLLDFNAARLDTQNKSEDTRLIGTKGYAAPEQYGFGTSDARTDIYGIGMLMIALLTGHPVRESVPDLPIKSIIMKCTEIDPSNRYYSVLELKASLQKHIEAQNNKSKTDKKGNRSLRDYLPPGYRTGNATNMLLATFIYAFLIYVGVTMSTTTSPYPDLICMRTFSTIMFLAVCFFTGNYLNCQRFFKICSHNNLLIRLLGIIAIDIIIIFLFILIIAIVSEIIA